jgi:hypothetical protein
MITNMYYIKVHIQDALEDSKEVSRWRKSKYIQDYTEQIKKKENVQKDKQWSTKHYTEN